MWYMMRARISSNLYRAKHWDPRWSHVTRLRSSSMLCQRIPSLERSDCRIARPQWSEIMGQSLYSEFWSNISHIVSNLNHLLLLPVTLRQPVSSPRPDACIIASFLALSVQSISCVCLYQRASCLNQGGKAERSCATHNLDIFCKFGPSAHWRHVDLAYFGMVGLWLGTFWMFGQTPPVENGSENRLILPLSGPIENPESKSRWWRG